MNVGATAAVVAAGEDFEVQCTIRNTGTSTTRQSRYSTNLYQWNEITAVDVRDSTVKEIRPDEEVSVFWIVRRFPNPTVVSVSVSLKCQTSAGEERQTTQESVVVLSQPPKLAAKVVKELYTYTEKGSVVLGNKHLCIVFVRGS